MLSFHEHTPLQCIYNRYIKRFFDIVMSLIAIFLLSPFIPVLSVLIRIMLGKPVLFRQNRPGLNEKVFTLYKFRTMSDRKDKDGRLLPDRLRLTKLGIFLRHTSLDELPELWNILCGDMSFVGPRPLLEEYLPYYTDTEKLRHCVRPGLTGLAQVSGRNFLSWDKRLMADVSYVQNISFGLDIKIMLKSVIKLIKREDIAIDSSAVEGNFAEIRGHARQMQ